MTTFPEIVADRFSGLSRFGFRISERSAYWVTFERHDVHIIVSSDPRGELEMSIAPTRPDNLEAFVARLAALLFEKYEPVLLVDLGQLDELEKLDKVTSRDMTRRYTHGPALRAADEAWKKHDYPTVARILGAIEAAACLQPLEIRRLNYARKHAK